MFDNAAKKLLDPWLEMLATRFVAQGVTANSLTIAGLAFGTIAAALIALDQYGFAIAFILISRLCDGLDGAVARKTERTDFGGYLDIVLDFAFYGLIPVAFVAADPDKNAIAAAVLLLSFYVNGGSFLAFAVFAEKRGLPHNARGSKSFLFTTGLAEATETLMVFVAMCLFSSWFAVMAALYALVVFYTAVSRVLQARASFGP